MKNPNNCEACDHKRHPDGGWCYMFREEPRTQCMQHTKLRGLGGLAAALVHDDELPGMWEVADFMGGESDGSA